MAHSLRAKWNQANARLANKPFDDLFRKVQRIGLSKEAQMMEMILNRNTEKYSGSDEEFVRDAGFVLAALAAMEIEGKTAIYVDAARELDETAKLFQLICMYPRYVAEEKPEGADDLAFNFALCAAQAMATDDEPDYYLEG